MVAEADTVTVAEADTVTVAVLETGQRPFAAHWQLTIRWRVCLAVKAHLVASTPTRTTFSAFWLRSLKAVDNMEICHSETIKVATVLGRYGSVSAATGSGLAHETGSLWRSVVQSEQHRL